MATKPRAIFEDVTTTERPVPVAGVIDRGRPDARRWVRLWLLALFGLVVVMIVVGGLTRLTDSGLSITEWNLVTGTVPPLNAADWQAEFDLYRQSPQYELMNRGMTLAEFQVIYWWEWAHRLLGRVIGAVFIAGFLGFWVARRLASGWVPRLLALGALIGLQGVVGWWMVHSGLQDGMTSVASYRLAVHLGLAFVILGLIVWHALLLSRRETELMTARRQGEGRLFSMATGLVHLLFIQIVLGALVAGIDAGRAYPTWPDMAGGVLPPGPLDLSPVWRNFFENPGLVQFIHRTTGYLFAILAVIVWLRARRSPHASTRRAFHFVLLAMAAQVALGVWAVLSMAQLHVAITHQAMAILLWTLAIRGRFLARHPVAATIRG
ncbi:heme A synthase [Rubellimicrobium aerolatum]|uniref:Heme A synthase n=1 Tax=Rubellimicrobium aerolatum TaxID=490979 RepID=A0ABW0S845_9RHOB|nr:heme A synthase [Rubellimicrobium aerolatum]MBP1804350.1 cytochrome c oxidase assembly protein subunit 15 [Rubellimicrobium aerolatum]